MNPITAFTPTTLPSSTISTISTSALCMAEITKPEAPSSRRLFVQSGVATSAAFFGIFVNFDGHSDNCNCGGCTGAGSDDGADSTRKHGLGCECHHCMKTNNPFRPLAANAYERDVGGDGRSAATYAMNLQAKETNARLEKGGFKLDTKEEEATRLSEAFASFSYDSEATKGQKSTGKGYGNKNASNSNKSAASK